MLEFSARRALPSSWTIDVRHVLPTRDYSSPLGEPGHVTNTQKMMLWADAVERAPDGERIALVDTDAAIVRPLDAAWATPFDVAVTQKPPGARLPFNGGVVFVRATPAARVFMRAWATECERMIHDPGHHQLWRRRYGGIAQAALGSILCGGIAAAAGGPVVDILPADEWNVEDETVELFSVRRTRIVHVKGRLRAVVFHRGRPDTPGLERVLEFWRALERDMGTS